ncbi:related to Mitochondrial import inner membrane translocase subunit TIM50 [Cephalotrichum gorgonifer]|uniref:Mitochondrial import inner membrane translocase subunit TIM50 n=1 Tax=Cephalotrichum gorgonifer TaxID=2041049 RepID=A0AAE8MXJ8_9PEZI|nr:related to Mitochondrial import inner membrane translocase subunit TIM50 [Cephalotrichum gorgonifer]
MISRLAVGIARQGAMRASSPVVSLPAGLYAARSRSFAWTRSLKEAAPRDPKNSKDADAKSSDSQKATESETPKSTDAETGKAAEESSPADAEQPAEPKYPLPDLTQGIPSTFEYEASQKARSALTEHPEQTSGRHELPASAYISSTDRKRQSIAKWSFILALAGMVGGVAYLGRDWESEEEAKLYPQAPNGFSPAAWWKRAVARSNGVVTYFAEPAFETLLPKVDPMLEKPYTLCISLEDMLVHSEWSREHGWRVAKRPGVDYFLRYLSQYYELVLFTSIPSAIALPVIQKLDPFQMIMFPLFREATKYEDGEFVKDLSYLNRDLSKVIILDTNPAHVKAQPENAIILPKWTGAKDDKGLVSLIPFLEYIHTMQYGDVRKVLKAFEGKDIPMEFAAREAIARREFQKQQKASKSSGSSGVGFLGAMLGLKPTNMSMMQAPEGEQAPSQAYAQGKMIQDLARERGMKYVELLEADIKANGERYLKEQQEAQEKQQQEAMESMMGSMTGMFVGGKKEAGGEGSKGSSA